MNGNYEYKKRFYDLEKEENFLNEMSEKGLALKEIKWGAFADVYRFEPCDKRYVYREDYNAEGAMEEMTSPYIKFVTGTYGCEFVCIAGGKVYFRKTADSGDFPPVYTDLESRIAAEKKRFYLYIVRAVTFIVLINIAAPNCFNAFHSDNLFGRMAFIFSIVAIIAGIVCIVYSVFFAVCHRRKIKELKDIQSEKGGE